MQEDSSHAWMQPGRRLLDYRVGGDYPDKDLSLIIGLVVGVGGALLLIAVCLAACCGCMIPSQECFIKMGEWFTFMRARCWCNCCGWRRKRSDWIDPEMPHPHPQEKHRPCIVGPAKEALEEWGTTSRDRKEALSSVIVTSSDCSEPIPAAAGSHTLPTR